MHTGIMLHMQVSPHIIVSIYKCYISSPCVKLPWLLKLWWDWYHLISGLFTSLLSVRQLGSLCSTERNRHLEGVLPVLFAWAQGKEESGSGYVVFSPLTVRGVQSFVLGWPFQHPILLLPMALPASLGDCSVCAGGTASPTMRAETHSAAAREPFWRWGKLQDTSVGKGETQVFVMDSQKTETRWSRMLSINPAQNHTARQYALL